MAFAAKARAKVGAKLLDILRPGWAANIKEEVLNLASGNVCILGQLFGEYSSGAEKLFAMAKHDSDSIHTPAERSGFVILPKTLRESGEPEGGLSLAACYGRLTEAWKTEVRKRRRSPKRYA